VELSYSHTSLSGVASFIASLGSGPRDAGLQGTAEKLKETAKDCGCRTVAARRVGTTDAVLLLFGLAFACGRRRRSAR
jgi:adenylosuccinate synthase